MTHSRALRIGLAYILGCMTILIFTSTGAFAQTRPDLGTAATYAVFTSAGSITVITGDTSVLSGGIGYNTGSLEGFPPSTATFINEANGATAIAASNLLTAYDANCLTCGTVLGTTITNVTLVPGDYSTGAASTTGGNITFNAQGDSAAIFIVNIGSGNGTGSLTVASGTHMLLENNARAGNIYWFIGGAVTIHDSATFTGTIIAGGAIIFLGQSTLTGRALTTAGAINLAANHMSISNDTGQMGTNKLTVVKPASGDTILSGTKNDTIKWSGTGIANQKTLQYSLDSGVTWTTIATINNDSFVYLWNVPDTTSTKALVRVTDVDSLRGVSGIFKIISNKIGAITVIAPAAGALIAESTLDTIKWSGTGLTATKTFAYSLDNGATWTTIGKDTTSGFTYLWNVPDTISTKAVIRITDTNGVTGKSGIFNITASKVAAIVILRPSLGEMIVGGTQNYQITWSGAGIAAQKTFSLSLDGGLTWSAIGTITANVFAYSWSVPDTTSTQAVVRIIDANNDTGKSGVFTISKQINPGSIIVVHPAAGETVAGGMQNYQIVFTDVNVTPQKTLEYSLDGGATWNLIGSMNSEALTYSWANVPNVATTQALVRITDTNGVTGTSGLFTITMTRGVGSINSLTLSGLNNNNNIGNNTTLGISWTYTPDIGTSVQVDYSLDNMSTWLPIGTVPVTQSPNSTVWQTTATGYYNPVYIRVTSSEGMTATSIPFSIGSLASVASDAAMNGYSISNYPNPANEQTMIDFVLPIRSDVTLIVSDNLGRQISETSQTLDAGTHDIPFNTSQFADGIYTYTLVAGSYRVSGRMNVIR